MNLSVLMKVISASSLVVFGIQTASALEAQNPETLCERFVSGPEQATCQSKVKKISPDWYLASVCAKQFDDKSFYRCLELGKSASFSPTKLADCESSELNDESRISCIKHSEVKKTTEAYQTYQVPKRKNPIGSQRLAEGY